MAKAIVTLRKVERELIELGLSKVAREQLMRRLDPHRKALVKACRLRQRTIREIETILQEDLLVGLRVTPSNRLEIIRRKHLAIHDRYNLQNPEILARAQEARRIKNKQRELPGIDTWPPMIATQKNGVN